jgi:hypothetical protein
MHKEMYNIFIHKGNAIKVTPRFHLSKPECLSSRKQTTNASEDVGKRETLYTFIRNVN